MKKKIQVLESASVRPSASITSTGAQLILTKFVPVGVLLKFSKYPLLFNLLKPTTSYLRDAPTG